MPGTGRRLRRRRGLARFIREQRIGLLLDATHPYAAQISANAVAAAKSAGVPCWALRRPAWQPQPGDDWREIDGWAQLVEALRPFKRPLFTLGREPLQHLNEIPPGQFWTCAPWRPARATSTAKS